MKGSGSPFTGNKPDAMAQLTKICAMKIDDNPTSVNPENLSLAFNASRIILEMNQKNKEIIKNNTIKPNSSPIALTIKSDS